MVGCGNRLEKLATEIYRNEQGEVVSIHLERTEITDAGLVHLKGLTNLHTLWLDDTLVSPAGVAELQKALPNCKTKK